MSIFDDDIYPPKCLYLNIFCYYYTGFDGINQVIISTTPHTLSTPIILLLPRFVYYSIFYIFYKSSIFILSLFYTDYITIHDCHIIFT